MEVSDIARSRFFYDRFLLPLGFARFVADEGYLGYRDAAITLWLVRSHRPRIRRKPPASDEEVIAEHLAFRLPDAAAVRRREAELVAGEIYPFDRGEERPEFRPGYFSAIWVDPDGIVLELYAVPGGPGPARRATDRSPGRPRARPAARRAPAGRRGRAAR